MAKPRWSPVRTTTRPVGSFYRVGFEWQAWKPKPDVESSQTQARKSLPSR